MEERYLKLRKKFIAVCLLLAVTLICSGTLIVKGGVLDKVLIKLNIREAETDWSLIAWERSLDKLDYDADIVFFGDSIISGSDFQEAFPNQEIIELGLPGDSLVGMISRVDMIKSVSPEKIFIMGGINSIRNGNEITLQQYQELLLAVKEGNPESEIYVMSVLPISETKEKQVTSNENIQEFNEELKDSTVEMGCTYIDLYDLYEVEGHMNPDLTKDGVHLKEEAYGIWEDAIREYIY